MSQTIEMQTVNIETLAEQMQLSVEQVTSLVRQELARKAASEKYRKSDAYKLRLHQQKLVRQALKKLEA